MLIYRNEEAGGHIFALLRALPGGYEISGWPRMPNAYHDNLHYIPQLGGTTA